MLRITTQDHVTPTPTVASIRTSLFNKFFSMKMQESWASMAGAGTEFDVVYEIV
jgi:hypothetical protein